MYEYDKLTQEQRNALVEERKVRGYPLHQPPHPVREQTYYLLTAACYEHQHHMTAAARQQQILDLLFEQVVLYGIEVYAWTVLTNHYHLLTHVPVFDALLNYIHFNPVKHGLVDSPYDWAWSSVHWYEADRGRDWLRDLWRDYPVKDYGKGWDEV